MKKTYIKPVVSRVNLVSDEAVLNSCKTTGSSPGILTGDVNCDSSTTSGEDCLYMGS